jgi:Ice-binding-like/Bacterial Ig-like domain
MRKAITQTIWMVAFFSAILFTGCGREQTVSPTVPLVVSTIPAPGATGVPVTQIISATFNEQMNPTTITSSTFLLTGPGAASVTGAVTYSGVTATFTPSAHLLGNTPYTATITTGAKDIINDSLSANFSWTFTTAPIPIVISTNPVAGALLVPLNQKLSATFSVPMNAATITAPGTFILALGPVGGPSVAGSVIYDSSSNTAIFSPTAALTANMPYTATITTAAQSAQGNNLAANFNWSFTTGATANAIPPTVISTNPATAAINVPLNQKIAATFSTPMNPATISAAGTFTLAVTAGGAMVPGTVTYSGSTAVFSPTANLTANTQYTATITTAAKDLTGVAMLANYVWNFTTGLIANAGAPTVISTIPIAGATGVPLNQKISATFSTAMNPATISAAGTFTVAVASVGGVAGANVPGTVAFAGNTAVFSPTANLAPTTQYTATITTAAQNLTGTALAANFVWSFTTGAAVNGVAPTITVTNPASAAINVPVNTTVNATFSIAMDPTTINNINFTLAIAGGGAAVTGTVTYNPATLIATFTPAANLTLGTQYTADVSNQAKSLTGVALAAGVAPNPWSFTANAAAGPVGPPLGAAATFGTFGGGAGITNMGLNTIINGDIGTTAVSTAVTGFHDGGTGCTYTETPLNVGTVNGKIFTAPPPPTTVCTSEGTAATFAIATQAAADALTAYNNLSPANRPGGTDPGAGQLGGLVLAPGTYKAAGGTFMITGSDLTLDAQNNPNAIWVFQMAASLTVGAAGAPRSIILVNGAQAKNVFWQVGTAATINGAGGGTMVGTIIAAAGVTFSTSGNAAITTLNGRALGLNASVTIVNTVVNVPAP